VDVFLRRCFTSADMDASCVASTHVGHDSLGTGYIPPHDLAFFEKPAEASTLERASAVRGLLYKGQREERPQRDQAHVKWDEQCIAEHDKERGTRQKIDEPDTPFVRSPETSDSEDDTSGHVSGTSKPRGRPVAETAQVPEGCEETRAAASPDSMAVLADRLNELAKDSRRDSKSSIGSGEALAKQEGNARSETTSVPSKIQLPEDEGRKSSSDFKEKRAKHYNEFAAIKALRQKKFDSESSADSNTSDEEAAAAKKEKKERKAKGR